MSRWPARSRAGEAHSREVSLAAGCQGSLVFSKLDAPLKAYLTRRCRQSVGTCASFVLDIRSVTFSTVHLCHVLLCHFCTCVHFRRALECQAKRCLLICYHNGLIDCPLRTSFTRRKNKPRHDTVLNGVSKVICAIPRSSGVRASARAWGRRVENDRHVSDHRTSCAHSPACETVL